MFYLSKRNPVYLFWNNDVENKFVEEMTHNGVNNIKSFRHLSSLNISISGIFM